MAWQLFELAEQYLPNSWLNNTQFNDQSGSGYAQQNTHPQAIAADNKRYGHLTQFSPFGERPSQVINPDAVPRTRLKLKLTGVLANAEESRSLAIIERRSAQTTYHTGDTIKGTSVEIVSIYADRVIIQTQGRHEALLLYPDQAASAAKVRAVKTGSVRKVTSSKAASESVHIIDAALVSQLRRHPNNLMEHIAIEPFEQNGKLKGYRINPGSDPALFQSAGLQQGDIALAINGYDLTSFTDSMQLMASLPSLKQASLSVERQGRVYQIEFSL